MITNPKEYFKILEEMQKDDTVLPIIYQKNEPIFEVDLNDRSINIPKAFSDYIAIQGDHDVETIYFLMDRYFDTIDLSECTCIVQYRNASKEYGIYHIHEKDLVTYAEEGKMILGWKLDKGFTKSAGAVAYSLRIYKLNNDNNFIYDLNIIPAIGNIAPSIDALDKVNTDADPAANMLAELIQKVDKAGVNGGYDDTEIKERLDEQSKKIVELSGLKDDLIEVSEQIPFNIIIENCPKKMLYKSGSISEYESVYSKITNLIHCKESDTFLYKGHAESEVASVVWYNEDKKSISYNQINSKNDFVELIAPQGACYARFSSFEYGNKEIILEVVKKYIEEEINVDKKVNQALNNISNLSKEIGKIPLGDRVEIVQQKELIRGFVVRNSGILSSDTGYRTDYIEISKLPTVFYLSASTLYAVVLGCIYDADKQKIAFIEDYLGITHGEEEYNLKNQRISKRDLLAKYPNAVYVCFSTFPRKETFELYTFELADSDIVIEKLIENSISTKIGNILFGKKWTFCGDSFTEGNFSKLTDEDGNVGKDSPMLYDKIMDMYKTYPWWIINRNNMKYTHMAKCGAKLTGHFMDSTHVCYYQKIPLDSDYITIAYGLNDGEVSIGEITDTEPTTWYGAFNTALSWISENIPKAKVLLIANDAWFSYTQRECVKKVAHYWGVGFLDLKGADVPLMIGGKYTEDGFMLNAKAKTLADAKYKVSSDDSHPNLLAHKQRSTIIESALRGI